MHNFRSKYFQLDNKTALGATKNLVLQGKQASKRFYHSLLAYVDKHSAASIIDRLSRFPIFHKDLLHAQYDSKYKILTVVNSLTVEKFHECSFGRLKHLDDETIENLKKQAQAVVLHVINSDFYLQAKCRFDEDDWIINREAKAKRGLKAVLLARMHDRNLYSGKGNALNAINNYFAQVVKKRLSLEGSAFFSAYANAKIQSHKVAFGDDCAETLFLHVNYSLIKTFYDGADWQTIIDALVDDFAEKTTA